MVIGIRSIGTSLSAVVAAALAEQGRETRSYTVRPRGHPFDRSLRTGPELTALWRDSAADAHFLIVDEGPGLSGSSFASVAARLSECGVPDDRIFFFPSRDLDGGGLLSASARDRWRRHARYPAVSAPRPPDCGNEFRDISAGGWRALFYAGENGPAVHPEHERVKFIDARGRRIWKFEGLGSFGARKLERARELAHARFATRPIALAGGFLESEVHQGQPLAPGEATTPRCSKRSPGMRRTFARISRAAARFPPPISSI